MKYDNRKARYEYTVCEELEAGIVLEGQEVKSIRIGNASLSDSFCKVKDGEIFVSGMHISHYENAREILDQKRARKLLLKKDEIRHLSSKVAEKGFTLIPLSLYFNARGKVKVKIGLCKGKRKYEKREILKQRDLDRELKMQ